MSRSDLLRCGIFYFLLLLASLLLQLGHGITKPKTRKRRSMNSLMPRLGEELTGEPGVVGPDGSGSKRVGVLELSEKLT